MSAKNKAAALIVFGMLSACAVGPDFARPDAPPVTHYANGSDPAETVTASGTTQRFVPGGPVEAEWWHLFQSPKLDAVIAEALANSPNLEAAQANLRQSQDNLRSGYGIFFPEIDAGASATRQKSTPIKAGIDLPPSIFNLFTLSATVSYTLDIWGGNRRLIEGLGAQADLAQATLQATYLTLESNIVNTVIARAAYRDEIKATQELIDLQKEQVRLAEIQESAGTIPYSSVLSLRSQLESTQATLPQLEQKLTQSEDLLASLVGQVPAAWQAPDIDLADLTLPADLPVSLPSDLTRQRPDLLVAEATAHTASANVGVATAALFPTVTLNGNYGANSITANSLFTANSNFWSAGASATMPVFDAGTQWYKREAASENYQQALAIYRQTVLNAFAQVADTLRALDHDALTLQAEDAALKDAAENLHLVQANDQAGLATYLDVLNADAQLHQTDIARLQAMAARYQDTVALFAALGGGWWNEIPTK